MRHGDDAGDIAIDTEFFLGALASGDNALLHEFAHLVQRTGVDAGLPQFPAGFPHLDTVLDEFESPAFQAFIINRFFGGNPPLDASGNPISPVHFNAETFPTLLNLFRQFPQELHANSPEIYNAFVEYYGYDPLTQQGSPPTGHTSGLQDATDTILQNFDAISAGDDIITRNDVENMGD